jgi:hypothetical protein
LELLEIISDGKHALADWAAFWTGNASKQKRTLNEVGVFAKMLEE